MQEENKDKKASPLYSEFAYDDAYRTMETECDDIISWRDGGTGTE